MLRTGDANQETVESFCGPYVRRIQGLDRCMGWVRSASIPDRRAAVIEALRRTIMNNEHWRAPHMRCPKRLGGPAGYPCVREWWHKLDEAKLFLATLAPTAQATLSGCSCQSHQDLQGLDDCQSYIHAHKAPKNVGANAHPAGYGWCADAPPPAPAKRCPPGYNYLFGRCVPMIPLSGVGDPGDAVPQTLGPDTARHLARYAIHAAQLAPKLYNPASAMDQVLEAVSPGLSKKVTAKAGAMMLKGVMPQTALEEAITESLVELAPKYPKYPKVPQQPALSGLGTTTTTTTRSTGRAANMRAAGSLIGDAGGAIADLIGGITSMVVGIQSERRAQDQQSFDQRMAQLEADRRAVEDAALREAGGLPLQVGGGGIGVGTILLVGLGLATAGGAIYYVTKKK